MNWRKTPDPIPTGWPLTAKGNGLNICFGRHTGYGGYSEIMRGARHIVIYEGALGGDNAIETWNRLENGEVSGKVMLNSTYGTDKYPEVIAKFSNGEIAPANIIGRADNEKLSSASAKIGTKEDAKTKSATKTTKSMITSKISKTTSKSRVPSATTNKTKSAKSTTLAHIAASTAKLKAGD